jgi:hypothetical protein
VFVDEGVFRQSEIFPCPFFGDKKRSKKRKTKNEHLKMASSALNSLHEMIGFRQTDTLVEDIPAEIDLLPISNFTVVLFICFLLFVLIFNAVFYFPKPRLTQLNMSIG